MGKYNTKLQTYYFLKNKINFKPTCEVGKYVRRAHFSVCV
jgi:hypothetical protein